MLICNWNQQRKSKVKRSTSSATLSKDIIYTQQTFSILYIYKSSRIKGTGSKINTVLGAIIPHKINKIGPIQNNIQREPFSKLIYKRVGWLERTIITLTHSIRWHVQKKLIMELAVIELDSEKATKKLKE